MVSTEQHLSFDLCKFHLLGNPGVLEIRAAEWSFTQAGAQFSNLGKPTVVVGVTTSESFPRI